jgi:hypothetical protein
MALRKDIVIYERNETKVYINKCRNPGLKTSVFAVRKDSKNGLAEYLGHIKWNGAWRQYCFYPELETIWSSGCLQGITDFLTKINQLQRMKQRKK